MNTVNIVDAISNKQYTAAEEGLAQLLRDKLQSAVIERKRCRCQKPCKKY